MNAMQIRAWLALAVLPPIVGGAGDTTTTFANVLKEVYTAQDVVNLVNVESYWLDKVKKAKDVQLFQGIGGRYFFKPARTGLSGGVGPRGENAALPTPGNFAYQGIQVKEKYHYGVVQVSGPLLNFSKGDRNAFAEGLKITMDGMLEEFELVTNILLHGYGAGVLGTVASFVGGVITLNDDIHPTRYLYIGMKIDSYTTDTQAVTHDTAMVVTAVNRAARTVTVTGGAATAAGDVLVLSGVGTNVTFNGLLGNIDDGNYLGTINNLTRSSIPLANAARIKATGDTTFNKYGMSNIATNTPENRLAVTEDIIQQMIDAQQDAAGARRPIDLLYSSLGVRRLYFAGLVGDRRYENQYVFDGGWKALRYNYGDVEAAWMANEFALRYTVFGLFTGTHFTPPDAHSGAGVGATSEKPVDKIRNEEQLAIYEAPWGGADWDDVTGSQLKQVYSSTGALIDATYAMLKWYFEFTTLRSNDFGRLDACLGG